MKSTEIIVNGIKAGMFYVWLLSWKYWFNVKLEIILIVLHASNIAYWSLYKSIP